MFSKILVANRGEIAHRVIGACRLLSIPTVALFSDADRDGSWLPEADESCRLKGESAVETYLDQEAILRIAAESGADAIHPGYGFLSENADFAEACRDSGIVFIGPSPEAMRALGDKASARKLAIGVGVPVIPGFDGAGLNDQELSHAADNLGYPVLIKASAGGGGRGMRVVNAPEMLGNALHSARAEAKSAFGDDHLLLEKYFPQVHHVEIQIVSDVQGNILHLFERECSIQRRHQKIIEESPAPILAHLDHGDRLLSSMASAAVSLAHRAGYVNAGTVEFVVDAAGNGDDRFYFLEMNTRLQVEHPVTEMVTGLDLVAWQIGIAAGEPLPFDQSMLTRQGHAIECRIYAEDPADLFRPSTGKIHFFRPPLDSGVRVDSGIQTGSVVTPYYDPMLAKITTWGRNRDLAVRRMVEALKETVVLGVTTNIPFLLDLLGGASFRRGRTTTSFLEAELADWKPDIALDEHAWLLAGALEQLQGSGSSTSTVNASHLDEQSDPWNALSGWRNAP